MENHCKCYLQGPINTILLSAWFVFVSLKNIKLLTAHLHANCP